LQRRQVWFKQSCRPWLVLWPFIERGLDTNEAPLLRALQPRLPSYHSPPTLMDAQLQASRSGRAKQAISLRGKAKVPAPTRANQEIVTGVVQRRARPPTNPNVGCGSAYRADLIPCIQPGRTKIKTAEVRGRGVRKWVRLNAYEGLYPIQERQFKSLDMFVSNSPLCHQPPSPPIQPDNRRPSH
jgi:hypothetical protein